MEIPVGNNLWKHLERRYSLRGRYNIPGRTLKDTVNPWRGVGACTGPWHSFRTGRHLRMGDDSCGEKNVSQALSPGDPTILVLARRSGCIGRPRSGLLGFPFNHPWATVVDPLLLDVTEAIIMVRRQAFIIALRTPQTIRLAFALALAIGLPAGRGAAGRRSVTAGVTR